MSKKFGKIPSVAKKIDKINKLMKKLNAEFKIDAASKIHFGSAIFEIKFAFCKKTTSAALVDSAKKFHKIIASKSWLE